MKLSNFGVVASVVFLVAMLSASVARAVVDSGPGGNGVTAGNSDLIGVYDYTETWTIGATASTAARQTYTPQAFPLPAGVTLLENTHGNPSVNWDATSGSIATDLANSPTGSSPYPGGSGAGSATGFTQTGISTEGNFTIPYGLRNNFIVQTDTLLAADRVDIFINNAGFAAGTQEVTDITDNVGLAVFFRDDADGLAKIGVYNGITEIDTGLTTGLPTTEEERWHNFTVQFNLVDGELGFWVNESFRGTFDFQTAFPALSPSNAFIGIGSRGAQDRLWTDNFQVGGVPGAPPLPPSVSLSTDVLNEGSPAPATYADGYNNNGTDSTVELVRFVPTSDASPIDVAYNQTGDTIDVSQFVVAGPERGAGQGLQVNGYGSIPGSNPAGTTNLFLRGEPNVNNEGFGAHANWIVTFDLDDIRSEHLGDFNGTLNLTGDFGIWGAAAAPVEAQGVIFLDGVRIDSMPEATATVNQSFDLDITSGRWLTFGIFNGDGIADSTMWDDALFRNVTLTVSAAAVPEPSTLALAALGILGLLGAQRMRRSRAFR